MSLESFEPVFGEPKVEWDDLSGSTRLLQFLFHAYAPDSSQLRIFVTDFHHNHWEAVRSIDQLEDIRDSMGIAGSWSDFIAYIVASLKSENVKLYLQGHSNGGAASAKLTSQKAKGMPRISFSLAKVVESDVSEAKANLSMELFKAFKSRQKMLSEEQECSDNLKKEISAAKERIADLQRELDLYSKRQKLSNSDSEKAGISAYQMNSGLQNSSNKTTSQDSFSTKIPKRVPPAYRRAKVRGALLQNTDDDENNS